ncbi:MAG TPA: D-glycerate dehydrogenase, partial [Candidatus Methylomirabilis sp.]|nr:D-glycerate dehydrogenase [Candidatus Methylomirabilis sp.]
MKPKVLITRMLPQPALDIALTQCNVDLNRRDVRYAKKQLIRRLKGKAGMICLLTDTIDAEVLRKSP